MVVCRERKSVRYTLKNSRYEDTIQPNDEGRVAHYWWSLVPNTVLPLSHGGTCRVLFAGYPGGSAGPDVRDAVLLFDVSDSSDRERCVGNVEFHLRASDWVAHQHHTDPRYNEVRLHIVLQCDTPYPTLRQDGFAVPVCSLYDMTTSLSPSFSSNIHVEQDMYPCYATMSQQSDEEREQLLQRAGMLRFEQKRDVFVEEIHRRSEREYHLCLIPALAEGLAYGRDRAFFRAVALRLLGVAHELPEPLGRSASPAPLDSTRLAVIHTLVAEASSLWPSLRQILRENGCDIETTLQTLREWFHERGVSMAHADILLCNVVLPFTVAISLIERDEIVGERAIDIYRMHPGLVSNRITRRMTTQLHLSAEPHGACLQQGLQYIYQQTCRAKLCDECIVGRERL